MGMLTLLVNHLVCAGGLVTWGELDKAAVETCICAVALSLSVVMAGSGHLQTMRLIRGVLLRASFKDMPLFRRCKTCKILFARWHKTVMRVCSTPNSCTNFRMAGSGLRSMRLSHVPQG